MRPTEILKEEHKVIKLMLKIIDKVCDKLEKKQKVDKDDLKSIIEFIRIFADKCHHGKEEDRLFPKMEEYGVPREGGPIGVMLQEYELGRSYVRNASSALEKDNYSEFVENIRNYVELLEQHIDKEDNILYMIADMHIPEKEQKKLVEEFERFEKEEIGERKHEEFHNLVHKFEKKYL